MKQLLSKKYGKSRVGVFAAIFLIFSPFAFVIIPQAVAQGTVSLVLFYRVRFEILGQSPKGEHYIQLFDTHTREITLILRDNPSMISESLSVLHQWQSNLDAMVNGRGDEVTISEEHVKSVMDYLDEIVKYTGPELKRTIEEELSITPLEATVGMTMNEAWRYLNNDSRFIPLLATFPAYSPMPGRLVSPLYNRVYTLDYNNELWNFLSLENGISNSWELVNFAMPDCALATPRSVFNPYLSLDITSKELRNIEYNVQTANTKVGILYVLYQPTGYFDDIVQANQIFFIIYPGMIDPSKCIEQSESVLATLDFPVDTPLYLQSLFFNGRIDMHLKTLN
jgi:hypothetical protein